MLRNNRPQCLGRFRGLEATGSVTLALDQGPTGPWGHQSLGCLEGNLEMAALAHRAVPAGALSSGSRPADPTGGSGWHSVSEWSSCGVHIRK